MAENEELFFFRGKGKKKFLSYITRHISLPKVPKEQKTPQSLALPILSSLCNVCMSDISEEGREKGGNIIFSLLALGD